jgi:hypothetical protein
MIWSGSLFRVAAVEQIGLPTADYVADMGEFEYGYRARRLGFTSYMVHNSVIHHDVGRRAGVLIIKSFTIGRWTFPLRGLSPWRAYYASRNPLYFGLYQCRLRRPRQVFRAVVQGLLSPVGFVLRPVSQRRQLIATLRGLWHGLTAQMRRRYSPLAVASVLAPSDLRRGRGRAVSLWLSQWALETSQYSDQCAFLPTYTR